MAEYTITYSDSAKGWQSFYSYRPEMMIGMNNRFYSFHNGKLYQHNSDEVGRNQFYGVNNSSSITGVINEDPYSVKTFKTFSLDSTAPWSCTFTTDLGSGEIDASWFELKEGDYFSHIRRTENDNTLELRSAQGVGTPVSVDGSNTSAVVITFSFNVDSIISVGDKLYSRNGSSNDFSGVVVSVNKKTVTANTTVSGASVPLDSNYLFYVKDSVAESYGTTGYFMKYTLSNSSLTFVELFSVGSSLFKSYP